MPHFLNVLIGVFFVYFIFSLCASALVEAYNRWRKTRQHLYYNWLQSFLSPTELQEFLNNKAVKAAKFKEEDKSPARLGTEVFTAAIQQLSGKEEGSFASITINRDDADRTQSDIGLWYNYMQDNLKDRFRYLSLKRLFVVSLLLSILFNIDSLAIYKYLDRNPNESARTAKQIESTIATYRPLVENAQKSGRQDDLLSTLSAQMQSLNNQLLQTKLQSLPLGYDADPSKSHWEIIHNKSVHGSLYNHLVGVLLSALAISLGAPFWYDIIRKLLHARSTISSINHPSKTPKNSN